MSKPTHVALIRGINVGGRNSLPMKDLTEILECLNCTAIRTYILTGNAVFRSSNQAAKTLAGNITRAISQRRDFAPHTLVLTSDDFSNAVKGNPFPEAVAEPKSLHLGFLDSTPKNPDLAKLYELAADGEQFQLDGRVFYQHVPDGIGRSRLATGAERAIGVPMTMRNWRTVSKLVEMLEVAEESA